MSSSECPRPEDRHEPVRAGVVPAPPPAADVSPGKQAQRRRAWASLAIRLVIGAVLVGFLFNSIEMRAVVEKFRGIRFGPAVALCIVAVADRALMAYKWNLLLRARGVYIPLWQATRLVFIGNLLGTFTPGAIGAEAYRVVALSPFKKTQVVVSTVILERFIGLAVIGAFAAVTLPVSARYLGDGSASFVWAIVLGAVLAMGMVVVSLCPSVVRALIGLVPFLSRFALAGRIRKFYEAYAESRLQPGVLWLFTALTALEVLVLVLLNYYVARTLGIGVSFGYLLCITPIMHILLRLPISFHGIGVFEGLFAYFLRVRGFPAADGVSIALLFRVAEVVTVFLPAAAMLWMGPARIQPPTAPGGLER